MFELNGYKLRCPNCHGNTFFVDREDERIVFTCAKCGYKMPLLTSAIR